MKELKEQTNPRSIRIPIEKGPSMNGKNGKLPQTHNGGATLEELRDEVAYGLLYTHSRANANSNKLLEVASFSYALIELLSERGLITIEEVDERKKQVHQRLSDKFSQMGMGVALTKKEPQDKGKAEEVEIDCENRLHLCHAACCRMRFALTIDDVENGKAKWNLGQPYMIRQGEDGYCYHLNRQSKCCSMYENRPFVCRSYDCRQDKRIWQDFEKKIVSPELEEFLKRPYGNGTHFNGNNVEQGSV